LDKRHERRWFIALHQVVAAVRAHGTSGESAGWVDGRS
jgi:hypothetical protein